MAIFRNRLASRQSLLYAFAAALFPIHVWSIFNLLKEIPAWVLRLSQWDLVGVIAYTQAFALLESLLLLVVLVIIGLVLPARIYKDRFVAQSAVMVFLASGWAIAAHFNDQTIRLWGLRQFLPWLAIAGLSIAAAFFLVYRYKRLELTIGSFVQRLAVLSFVYLFFDLASLVVVIVRNI